MSLFRYSDYQDQSKKATVYSKKVKQPTTSKTSKHKCSQCERTDAVRYPITEKENRWLCPICIGKNNKRDDKEAVSFVKASKLKGIV